VALLRKMTCNSSHIMSLCHPVYFLWNETVYMYICIYVYMYIILIHIGLFCGKWPTQKSPIPRRSFAAKEPYMYISCGMKQLPMELLKVCQYFKLSRYCIKFLFNSVLSYKAKKVLQNCLFLVFCCECVYICIYVYMYIYIYIDMYVCMFIYVLQNCLFLVFFCECVYICIYVYMHIYIYRYVCMYVYRCASELPILSFLLWRCIHMYICIYICIFICIYICI